MRRCWLLLAFALFAVTPLAGCTRSIDMTYTPSLYRLPDADRLNGIVLGVAALEDRRSWIDKTEKDSLGYFMQAGPWRFGLTYKGREFTPVGELVQSLFVEEFTRAGVQTKPIGKVLTKDAAAAMRAAGEEASAAYVLGGRVLVFEVVNEDKFWTVVSRRAVTLEVHLLQVRSGEVMLDSTYSQLDRRDEGLGVLHSTNVDRLMNSVFRLVVGQVVEQVAAKLALDPRDITVRIAMVRP